MNTLAVSPAVRWIAAVVATGLFTGCASTTRFPEDP